MDTQRLSYDELATAEQWLAHPEAKNPEAIEILSRALIHLRHLLKDNISRADLVKYLRIQMGIDPKSEKLGDQPLANQFPGSAIFRR